MKVFYVASLKENKDTSFCILLDLMVLKGGLTRL